MKSISRRDVLKAAGAAAAMSVSTQVFGREPKKATTTAPAPLIPPKPGAPNIVWIFCDELRVEALGCYGHPFLQLHTPNIDALAASGVRNTNHFSTSPVCVPSRVATLSGQYPEQTGVYNNEGAWKNFRLPKLPLTFPQVLAANSYATANFGKYHPANGMHPGETPGYNVFAVNKTEGGDMNFWQKIGEKKAQIIHSPGGGIPGGIFPVGEPYPPERVADNGIAWMTKPERGPFLARFSILQPHTPVIPPQKFYDLYADQDPKLPDKLPETLSAFEKRMAELHGLHRMDREQLRKARRCYYAQVAWVDAEVGRILAALKKHDLLENTLIIFGADHGTPVGDNGCFGKHSFAPCVHRVPLIMSWPGRIKPGDVRGELSDSLDIGPTMFGAAGIAKPESFRGRDLLNSKPPEQIFATIGFGEATSRMAPNGGLGTWFGKRGWPRRSCVRTAKYRLDMNMKMDGKPVTGADRDIFLADVQVDPNEQVNLAGNPKFTDEVARLAGLLEQHAAGAVEVPAECLTHVKGEY